jgi:hypothetical protein
MTMVEMTVQLDDDDYRELAERAHEAGVEPGQQLQAEVDALFDAKRQRLRQMIKDVVREHRELYQRLA